MSLSKETLETAGPAAKAAASAQGKPDLNKLRADAVSLDVPVRVHGSRVSDVGRGPAPQTEPFEEEASTMIVFPHGGVVRMATTVSVGQMLVLTNLRTNQDAICRVVKVRAYSNSQAYVEVEFTHRQPGYWGVRFPADDEESRASAVPPTPTVPETDKKPLISSVTVKVEAMPKIPEAPVRSESAFAPIGSQEDVQPPAAHTELKPPFTPPSTRISAHAPAAGITTPSSPKTAAPERSVEPVTTESRTLEDDINTEEPRTARTFGAFTGGTARPAISSDFGSRLDASISAQAQATAPRNNNWMWIVACLFFLVAGLAGGAIYFRQHAEPQGTAQAPVTMPQPSTSAASAPAEPLPVTPQLTQTDGNLTASPAPMGTIEERANRVDAEPVQQQSRLAENAPAHEMKSPAPTAAFSMPAQKNFAPTNARPVARAIETSRMAAPPSLTTSPAVGAASGGSAALPGVLTPSDAALPPPPPSQQPLTRVRVGGVIIQPKLLHSVAPSYPSAARSAGISGNVVIVAHVDKMGNVASMKVVSGPATLQAAAMSALRSWKYQPATLDGVPIATDVTVTIKFQQQ